MPLNELPPDAFNVEIQNEMDRLRLIWLVNKIGEAKLRKSVAKHQARWPGTKPFVSTLLGWYHLKVPVNVYAPERVPVYWLYVLYRCDGSEVKIGMTGDWPRRAWAEVPRNVRIDAHYDLNVSRAYLIGGDKAEVLRREKAIKDAFAPCRSRHSDQWNSNYTEWFRGEKIAELLAMASSFNREEELVVQTLAVAISLLRDDYDPALPRQYYLEKQSDSPLH